jgi:hypothetical protein
VRDDCSRRLDEVDRAQPTIILDVKDVAGNDLTDVRVMVDGALVAEKLDGVARRFDPGVHAFAFEIAGQPTVTRTFVIQESEKERRVTIVAEVGRTAHGSAVASRRPEGGQRVVGVGALGLGAVGVVVGSVFGALAESAWHAQQSACGSSPACSSAGHAAALLDHSTLTTDGVVSTTAFIAGGILTAAGALLLFTAPTRVRSARAAVTLTPVLGLGRASMDLQVRF